MKNNVIKSFDILATSIYFSILHNYFDSPKKLFSDLYLTKFLDTFAKLSFLCNVFSANYLVTHETLLELFTMTFYNYCK